MAPETLPARPGSLRRTAGDVFLFVRIVAGLAIIFGAKDGRPYVHHLAFLIGVALVSWAVRGVGWAAIYDAFLAGVLCAYGILALQWLIEVVLLRGVSLTFRAAVVAPLTEEPLKILPLLLLLVVLPWRGRWSSGASDLMVLGIALGSGFGFVEDSLWRTRSYGDAIGIHVLGIPLTPDARGHFIGHGAASGFICLAIGWWIWMSRWKLLRVIAPLPALFVTFWMIVDHGLWNYSTSSMDRFTAWIWRLDGSGRAAPYLFVGAAFVTMFVEWFVLFVANSKLKRLPLSRSVAYVRQPLRKGFGYAELRMVARRIRGVFAYLLTRRQLGYLLAHRRGDSPVNTRRYAAEVATTVGRLLIAQKAITRT